MPSQRSSPSHYHRSDIQASAIAKQLKSHRREDLVNLIVQMLERSPDLLPLVKLSTPQRPGKAINLDLYKQRIEWAYQLQKMRDIATGLAPMLKEAQALQDSGNWQEGGELFNLLLSESIHRYDGVVQQIDYDGEVCCAIQDMAEGLSDCLAQAADADRNTRKSWLETLLQGVFKDIEIGGIDFAAGAWDGVLESAQPQEWDWIEQEIRRKIKSSGASHWADESLVRLLASAPHYDEDASRKSDLIEELGSPKQRVFLWVKQGQYDQAIALAQTEFAKWPGLIYQLADRLIQVGEPERAVTYVLSLPNRNSRHHQQWLEQYYEQFGDQELGLEATLGLFRELPSLQRYRKLKALDLPASEWETLKRKLFSTLEQQQNLLVLVDVLLEEKELGRAIAIIHQAEPRYRHHKLEKVALAVEKQMPEAAIALYQLQVQDLIKEKNRGSYRMAAEYLGRVRSLFGQLQNQAGWESYITEVCQGHQNLRALQDELKRAKL